MTYHDWHGMQIKQCKTVTLKETDEFLAVADFLNSVEVHHHESCHNGFIMTVHVFHPSLLFGGYSARITYIPSFNGYGLCHTTLRAFANHAPIVKDCVETNDDKVQLAQELVAAKIVTQWRQVASCTSVWLSSQSAIVKVKEVEFSCGVWCCP
eukprot:5137443-Amphidinium_carterae.5